MNRKKINTSTKVWLLAMVIWACVFVIGTILSDAFVDYSLSSKCIAGYVSHGIERSAIYTDGAHCYLKE